MKFCFLVHEEWHRLLNNLALPFRMQKNLHVLRLNAMPSVLIETGFISNAEEAAYLASEKGQDEIAESIYDAITSYKKRIDRNQKKIVEEPKELPLKNDFRILLMSTPNKYAVGDPALKGRPYAVHRESRRLARSTGRP